MTFLRSARNPYHGGIPKERVIWALSGTYGDGGIEDAGEPRHDGRPKRDCCNRGLWHGINSRGSYCIDDTLDTAAYKVIKIKIFFPWKILIVHPIARRVHHPSRDFMDHRRIDIRRDIHLIPLAQVHGDAVVKRRLKKGGREYLDIGSLIYISYPLICYLHIRKDLQAESFHGWCNCGGIEIIRIKCRLRPPLVRLIDGICELCFRDEAS